MVSIVQATVHADEWWIGPKSAIGYKQHNSFLPRVSIMIIKPASKPRGQTLLAENTARHKPRLFPSFDIQTDLKFAHGASLAGQIG